ncbi:MAG TPA: DUF4245 domain-containing protein [Pseudolysinimonas sp.]|nr:DUF4245 domain-containing protein [Pseudolysinimonas sp.]
MSPRSAGTDPESGRPIVAELGRPETPQETMDRKAASSLAHRRNQTTLNLVLALAASIAVVVLLVFVVVRPAPEPADPIDYAAVAADAQGSVTVPLIAPVLPDGWTANRAELSSGNGDGVTAWRIGFLTPAGDYIALDQGVDANPSWVSGALDHARSTGSTTIEGHRWSVYDRRTADDPGNNAYALVTEANGSTVVLSGTASDAEFGTLAASVAAELDS